jgi:hypothetical protein
VICEIAINNTQVVPFPNAALRKVRLNRIPSHCGMGHTLTPDNLSIDEGEQRRRCLQCGRESATAFRRRNGVALRRALC